MGPNVGDTAYINFAETFEEPRCREVLVVGIENSWIRVFGEGQKAIRDSQSLFAFRGRRQSLFL